MQVTVTQDDIDRGVPRMPCRCPIARALRRLFPTAQVYLAFWSKTGVLGEDPLRSLPIEARTFIRDFDRSGKRSGPFTFELDLDL